MRIIVAALALAVGCSADGEVVFAEEFECGGAALCGWKAAPTAGLVTTLHPGEHALELPGPDRATLALPRPVAIDACAEIDLVTDCFWGAPPGGGDWVGPLATAEGDTLVIRLSVQTYQLSMIEQPAPLTLSGPVELRAIAVDNPAAWTCHADSIAIVDPPGSCP